MTKKILLVMLSVITSVFICSAVICAASGNTLVVFPEYPEAITKSNDYSVTVTQGDVTKSVLVYNPMRAAGTTAGDDYRRFCEFDFAGSGVTVNITVNTWEISSYEVLPSAYGLTAFRFGNTIKVLLDEPRDFLVRINRDDHTILSVFAGTPETETYSAGDPGVMYYGAGWHDVPGGLMDVPANTIIYLAPGAVLNTRLTVIGSNVKILGRGMLRDGLWETEDTYKTMIQIAVGCENVTAKDIKLIDSRWYNVGIRWRTKYINIDHLRILSNQVSTDGVSFWGGVTHSSVTNCFIYNADNVFVFNTDGTSYNRISDCVVGSTCSIFFPQGSVDSDFTIENFNVFKCTGTTDHRHALVRNTYKAVPITSIPELTIQNVDASDCLEIGRLFFGDYVGGDYLKKFVLKNITLPEPYYDEGILIRADAGNYSIVLDAVRYNGKIITDRTTGKIKDRGAVASTFSYPNTVGLYVTGFTEPYTTVSLSDGRSVTSNGNGWFRFTGVWKNKYTLTFNKRWHISRTVPINMFGADIMLGSAENVISLFPGDLTGDGSVNVSDYQQFMLSYNLSSDNLGYNPETDFTKDGSVNVSDYQTFMLSYNKNANSYPIWSDYS